MIEKDIQMLAIQKGRHLFRNTPYHIRLSIINEISVVDSMIRECRKKINLLDFIIFYSRCPKCFEEIEMEEYYS